MHLLIIDRYMLRQFVQTFLICFFSLNGLFVVIDGMGNLEEFINFSRSPEPRQAPTQLLAVVSKLVRS